MGTLLKCPSNVPGALAANALNGANCIPRQFAIELLHFGLELDAITHIARSTTSQRFRRFPCRDRVDGAAARYEFSCEQ